LSIPFSDGQDVQLLPAVVLAVRAGSMIRTYEDLFSWMAALFPDVMRGDP
jgi:hypothetical protein